MKKRISPVFAYAFAGLTGLGGFLAGNEISKSEHKKIEEKISILDNKMNLFIDKHKNGFREENEEISAEGYMFDADPFQ